MRLSEITHRYRVSLEDLRDAHLSDRDFREQIVGRHGIIFIWDDKHIAVETEKTLYQNKFALFSDAKRISLTTFLFENHSINRICQIIKAKRRRQLTPKQREKQALILEMARAKHKDAKKTVSDPV
jgi:hypothetical protein